MNCVIAVDFDGTIVDHDFPRIGKEKPLAIRTLKDLQSAGCGIIIWTCREDEYIQKMIKWFDSRGFCPNAINANIEKIDFGRHKVVANYYFDDRSFPAFSGWKSVREYFNLGS